MSPISTVCVRKSKNVPSVVIVGVSFADLGSMALATQDKYTVQVPNGLALSEFRGYEAWHTVAISQSGALIEAILANPVVTDAYLAGVPGNGRNFPDGSKVAKIHWKAKNSAEAPAATTVPYTLHNNEKYISALRNNRVHAT